MFNVYSIMTEKRTYYFTLECPLLVLQVPDLNISREAGTCEMSTILRCCQMMTPKLVCYV